MIRGLRGLIDVTANIEYGILIAVPSVLILLFAISALGSNKRLNGLSYIIAAAMAASIAFHMSRLIGACNLSKATSAVGNIVGAVSPTLSKYVPSVLGDDLKWMIFRCILWSVLTLVVGGIGIWATMSKKRKKYHAAFDDYDSNVSSSTDDWGL